MCFSPNSSRLNFYPRPPRGGRQYGVDGTERYRDISIHALREEGDASRASGSCARASNFYPRPPRGGRQGLVGRLDDVHAISIHALREEGDVKLTWKAGARKRFLSTPSARRATAAPELQSRADEISIHALREEGDMNEWDYADGWVLFLSTPSARRATRRARRVP